MDLLLIIICRKYEIFFSYIYMMYAMNHACSGQLLVRHAMLIFQNKRLA